MIKTGITLLFLLVLVACQNNKEVKISPSDSFLAALSDSLSAIPFDEEDTATEILGLTPKTQLTEVAFVSFEKQLSKAFGGNIYEAFAPYENALDSCGLLTDTGGRAYLVLFEAFVKTNNLGLTDSCSRYMTDEEIYSFGNLVTAFVNTINSVVSERDKQSVGFALGNSIKRVVSTKNFTPKLLVDEITETLGKSNFDKKICRVAAICYLMSMTM